MEKFPVTEHDGKGVTEMLLLHTEVQPLASVTVTVKVEALDTEIHCVVAEVLQR